MHSLEEFKANAPAELLTATDDHQLMLNRLEFELLERKRMIELCLSLKGKKDTQAKEAIKKTLLAGKVDSDFAALLQVLAFKSHIRQLSTLIRSRCS